MKKRTLLAVVLTGALTVGAFAHGMNNQQNMQGQQNMQKAQGMMGGQNQQGMWNQNGMHRGQGMGMQGGMMNGGMMGGGMQMFSQLNLTSEQQFQLSVLRDEMRLEMRKAMHGGQQMGQMGAFFKGNSFDKTSFKKHMNEKHDKMLNLRADTMEKAFKILTKEQITQLKQNLGK